MNDYTYYKDSRISGEDSIPFFFTDLPLAGEFLTKDQIDIEKIYPLTLSFCPKSSSVQVNEIVHADKLFKNYFYKTGDIQTLVDHFREASTDIKRHMPCAKIMDIGCNDFTFLKNFIGTSDVVLGIDPSDISKTYQPNGCMLENTFFTAEHSLKVKKQYGEFDLIFSSNNFAHIENLHDYTEGVANLLSDNGSFVCEVHWVGTMLQKMQFPFIYHEHMYYHSLKAIIYLLEKHGLYVNDVERINIHGGSIRFLASKSEKQTDYVKKFLKEEEDMGLYNLETYKNFARKIEELKEKSRIFFQESKEKGKTVYGYGASGQANTLMSIFGITKEDLFVIIDDSPLKQGLYTPKNHILIKDRGFLLESPPDCIYLFAHTFEKEIRGKNKEIKSEWVLPI